VVCAGSCGFTKARAQEWLLTSLALADGVLADATGDFLGKALLKRFADASERVRDLAMSLFLALLQRAPDATLPIMPYAMPVLEERLSREPESAAAPREASEELRLVMMRTVALLAGCAGKAVAAYASEVVTVLQAGFQDAFNDVNTTACECMTDVARCLGRRLHEARLTAHSLPCETPHLRINPTLHPQPLNPNSSPQTPRRASSWWRTCCR